jgi:hypothetical protein
LQDAIIKNSLYFNFEDVPDSDGIPLRIVYARLNRFITYTASFKAYSPGIAGYSGSEAEAFDLYWSPRAGEKFSYARSWIRDNLLTADSFDFRLVDRFGSFCESYLYGGILAWHGASFGDNVIVRSVDKDDILGQGIGAVLGEFVNVRLHRADGELEFGGLNPEGLSAWSRIPAGIYLEVTWSGSVGAGIIATAFYEY